MSKDKEIFNDETQKAGMELAEIMEKKPYYEKIIKGVVKKRGEKNKIKYINDNFVKDQKDGLLVKKYLDTCPGKCHAEMRHARISAEFNVDELSKIKNYNDFVTELRKDHCASVQLLFWMLFAYIVRNDEDVEKRREQFSDICACSIALNIEQDEMYDAMTAVALQYNLADDIQMYKTQTAEKIFGSLESNLKESEITEKNIETKEDIFSDYFNAHYHVIFVDTIEESYAMRVIIGASDRVFENNKTVYEWNVAEGLINVESGVTRMGIMDGGTLDRVLDDIYFECKSAKKNKVYIFRTADAFLQRKDIVGRIKILSETIKRENKNIFLFFIARTPYIDVSIEKDVYLDYSIGYPNEESIQELLRENISELEITDEVILTCKGLTRSEIERAVKLSLVRSNKADGYKKDELIQLLLHEKEQIIRKSGLVELVDTESIPEVGGLDNLKIWLGIKSRIITNPTQAKKANVDLPRGVLLIGMPGCGKSLSAKTTAKMFNVPLLKLEMGNLMNKYQGESEHNFRDALKLAEAISPCVLWVDELEKAFNSSENGQSESSTRILGYLLNWMQERKSTTFVMATANEVKCLPPELLRKGRFDEVFFVDLPNERERADILAYHIGNRGLVFKEYADIARRTNNFSGAELEYLVRDVAEQRFLKLLNKESGEVTIEMFVSAIDNTTPLYQSMEEDLKEMRNFCKKRKFREASSK